MEEKLSETELSLVMMFRMLPREMQDITIVVTRRTLKGCLKMGAMYEEHLATCNVNTGRDGVRVSSAVDSGGNNGDICSCLRTEGAEAGWEAEESGDVWTPLGQHGN